ncbi:MAG: bifunctional phosphoglucose/phosphomannose isomerase [Bacteroidia bacterium]
MKSFIETFTQQLVESQGIADKAVVTPKQTDIRNIVLTGLGGSAFGGEITKGYLATRAKVPFLICREYEVPAFVNEHTLLLACSYSGNTEETLSAFVQAEAQGAEIVCITSGGTLKKWAEEKGKNLIVIPSGYPPRAAAGFAVIQQLEVLKAYNIIGDYRADMAEATEIVRTFADYDLVKEVAKEMKGKFLFAYASIQMESIAIRWRQQIEENSKQLMSHHIVPEMNHNELVGWKQPAELMKYTHTTFIQSDFDHARVRLRMDLNKQIIGEHCPCIRTVNAKGTGYMAQAFYLLHLGDWISYYLAEENQEDPSPVKVIDFLKNELAKV